VPDDNGFATFFVLESMLQTQALLNSDLKFDQADLLDTMQALGTHRSLNVSVPVRGDLPIYTFWNQRVNDQG